LHYNNVFDKKIGDMDIAVGDIRDGDGSEVAVSMGLMGLLGGGVGNCDAFGLKIDKSQEDAEKDFLKMMKEEQSKPK
jgi:hypothetical protein